MGKLRSFCGFILAIALTVIVVTSQPNFYYEIDTKESAYPQLMEAFYQISDTLSISHEQIDTILTQEEFQQNLSIEKIKERIYELLNGIKFEKYYTEEELQEIMNQFVNCYNIQIEYKNSVEAYPYIQNVIHVAFYVAVLTFTIIILTFYKERRNQIR